MFWYILLMNSILLIILMGAFAKHYGYELVETQFVWLCTVPMLCLMALRDQNVGIDTLEYVRAFSQIKNFSFTQAISGTVYGRGRYLLALEPGYRLLNWVTGLMSKNDQAIIVSGSLLIIVLLTKVCTKYSSAPILSVFMYLTLGIYQTHMNVSRNAIAIFICYAGISFIEKRQLFRYILCVLIGYSFHLSSVLFLPLYWLVNNVSFDNKRLRKVIIVFTIFVISFPFIKNNVARTVPTVYMKYFMSSTEDLSGLLVGILYFVLFVISIMSIGRKHRYEVIAEEKVGTWMLLLNILFFSLSMSMGNAARVAALFGPYIIIYIPNILERTKNKRTVTAVIIILCIIAYIGRMSINNIGKTIPYLFC